MQRVSLVLGAFSIACAPGLPRTPTTPQGDPQFETVNVAPAPGVAEDPPLEMRLYSGDIVSLRMQSGDRDEAAGLTVDERGMLHVPLAGDVQVTEVSLTDAERRVDQALRRFDNAVRVSIVITTPAGHQASVVGAVGTSGRYDVVPGMRVADLLAVAGGLAMGQEENLSLPIGSLEGARLVRNNQLVPIDVSLAMTGDPHHNVRVRPGDTLYVPADVRSLITVLGEVATPRVMAFHTGLRLTQALALAGGVTRDGDWGDVRVMRGPADHPRVYRTPVSSVVDGGQPDVTLAPGDIIYVASNGHADLRDVMGSVSGLMSILLSSALITPSVITLTRPAATP